MADSVTQLGRTELMVKADFCDLRIGLFGLPPVYLVQIAHPHEGMSCLSGSKCPVSQGVQAVPWRVWNGFSRFGSG